MNRRTVAHRETFGPFELLRTDDGAEYLKYLTLTAGGFHVRPAGAALTVDRLRELLQTIDGADMAAVATAERTLAQYPDDAAARALVAYVARRESALGE